jgi:branched-chain amino acid transport system substrate-binding protein
VRKKYIASATTADNLNVYGYSCAQTMVALLKASGEELTRENVKKQAVSIQNEKLRSCQCCAGVAIASADDFAPIKQMQLEKFDGTNWKLFGELQSGSNS